VQRVKVYVGDANAEQIAGEWEYADIDPDTTGHAYRLSLLPRGTARVLWIADEDESEGYRDALVHLHCSPPGTLPDELYDITYTGEHSEAASTKSYTNSEGESVLYDYRDFPSTGETSVKITLCTGVSYYDAGDQKLYVYVADFHFSDDGRLVYVEEERRVEVEAPEAC
jgi:hypothetical protein